MVYPERVPHHLPERQLDESCHNERVDFFHGGNYGLREREKPIYARNPYTAVDCLPPIALEQLGAFERLVRPISDQVMPGRGCFGATNEIGAVVSAFSNAFSGMPFGGFNFGGMPMSDVPYMGHHMGHHRPHNMMPRGVAEMFSMGCESMSPAMSELDRQILRRPVYEVGPSCYNVGWHPREEYHQRFQWGGYNHNGYGSRQPHHQFNPALPRTPGGHGTQTGGHGAMPPGGQAG